MPTTSEPINYAFNLLLTRAITPNSLNLYLEKHHPSLIRLASPRLHRLPKTLQTEYVNWTGGNKLAPIERRIQRVWAEDVSDRDRDQVYEKIKGNGGHILNVGDSFRIRSKYISSNSFTSGSLLNAKNAITVKSRLDTYIAGSRHQA